MLNAKLKMISELKYWSEHKKTSIKYW